MLYHTPYGQFLSTLNSFTASSVFFFLCQFFRVTQKIDYSDGVEKRNILYIFTKRDSSIFLYFLNQWKSHFLLELWLWIRITRRISTRLWSATLKMILVMILFQCIVFYLELAALLFPSGSFSTSFSWLPLFFKWKKCSM